MKSREWSRVAWPLAVLVLFAAAFRTQAEHVDRSDPGAECGASRASDVEVLERCLALASDDVEMMLELGRLHESQRRWSDAERVYRRATAVDPDDGDIHLRLGRVLLELGQLAAARKEGEAALAVQPGNQAALHLIERATSDGVKP
jgi:tetratricopeptide (TPR) repeat protein